MGKPKLLVQFIILVYELCTFNLNVLSHSSCFIRQVVSKMETTIDPGKWNTTKLYRSERLDLLLESYAFSFAFVRILMCTEFEIMFSSIMFTGFKHLLKRIKGRSKKKIIITITEDVSKDTFKRCILKEKVLRYLNNIEKIPQSVIHDRWRACSIHPYMFTWEGIQKPNYSFFISLF